MIGSSPARLRAHVRQPAMSLCLALSCCSPILVFAAVTVPPASVAPVPESPPASSSVPTPVGPPAASVASASQAPSEETRHLAQQKADYLYRFLGYVEFPRNTVPQAASPLVIGVMGADDVFAALGEVLALRATANRVVLRRKLNEGDSLVGVHLLFLGRQVDLAQSGLLKAARSSPVLIVSDVPDGLAAGAVFNFTMVGEHLRFEASLTAADRASLKVSSRVLALAERVTGVR